MKRTRIKLSLVKLNAIKYTEKDRGFIIIPINEVANKLKRYIVKLFRGETALKRAGITIDVYPITIEEEIYLVAEARRATATPGTEKEIKAIVKPETQAKEATKP